MAITIQNIKIYRIVAVLLCTVILTGLSNNAVCQDFDIYTYGSGERNKGPHIKPRTTWYPKGYLFKYGRKNVLGGPKAQPGVQSFYKKGYIARYGLRKTSGGPQIKAEDLFNIRENFAIFAYGSPYGKRGPRISPIESFYPPGYFFSYGRKNILGGPKVAPREVTEVDGMEGYGYKKSPYGGPAIKLPKKQKDMHPSAYHLNSKHKDSFKEARKYRKRKYRKLKGSDEATPDSQALEKIKKPKRMASEAQIWD